MTPPNVMLLVIDALRADAVFDSPPVTSTLDDLRKSGTTFVQCISTTTSTSPSFASILTGYYPPKHGVRGLKGHRLAPTARTIAEIFAGEGYSTAAWVRGPLLPQTRILRGFRNVRHIGGDKLPFMAWRREVLDTIAALSVPWLFLLHVWEVHRPYRPPPDYKKRRGRAGYFASVTATDRALAGIVDALPANTLLAVTGDHGEKVANNWIGDRASALAKEVRRRPGSRRLPDRLQRTLGNWSIGHGYALYESLIRVPMILAGPGAEQRVVTDQVRHVDLVPTIAELCGLEAPSGVDGRSLVPLMQGEQLPVEAAYLEATGVVGESPIYGLRTPEWKLLRGTGTRPELYRLEAYSRGAEKRNVYQDHPDIAKDLETRLDQLLGASTPRGSGMTPQEEVMLEKHLRDLGYL
jgi:arylsulfatase A-like enzyme